VANPVLSGATMAHQGQQRLYSHANTHAGLPTTAVTDYAITGYALTTDNRNDGFTEAIINATPPAVGAQNGDGRRQHLPSRLSLTSRFSRLLVLQTSL
jgi:hypothetical protein